MGEICALRVKPNTTYHIPRDQAPGEVDLQLKRVAVAVCVCFAVENGVTDSKAAQTGLYACITSGEDGVCKMRNVW